MLNFKYYTGVLLLLLLCNVAPAQEVNFSNFYQDGTYVFDTDFKLMRDDAFTTYKSAFGLTVYDEMKLERIVPDYTDETKTRFFAKYVQYHKGYEVEGSIMNLIGQHDVVLRTSGSILKGLNLNTENLITEDDAFEAIQERLGSNYQFAWESALEDSLKSRTDNPDATYYPTATLIIAKNRNDSIAYKNENYRLVWHIFVPFINTTNIPYAIEYKNFRIDAVSGAVFDEFGEEKENWDDNTDAGCTHYYGDKWIDDQAVNLFPWGRLHQLSCNLGRNITATNNGATYQMTDDASWCEDDFDFTTAITAYWGLQESVKYYLNRFGRWNTDYNGMPIHLLLNETGTIANYAGGPSFDQIALMPKGNFNNSIAALDIITHEYTHGMIKRSSGLGSTGAYQSKALNEAFADIFGVLAERDILGGNIDWSIGERFGYIVRRLDNPHNEVDFNPTTYQYITSNSPEKYLESGYWKGNDFHKDGGVLRKWYYLLHAGTTAQGMTVLPITAQRATDLAYISFNWWIWHNAGYVDAAKQIVSAAIYQYGYCSKEHFRAIQAWQKVGINLPMPTTCRGINVNGPDVVNIENESSFILKAVLTDEELAADGTYEWTLPAVWQKIQTGNTIKIATPSEAKTMEVSVTYKTVAGNTVTNKKIVHFVNDSPAYRQVKPAEVQKTETTETQHISIFPNPANSRINIQLDQNTTNGLVRIYTINGQLVSEKTFAGQNVDMNLPSLANGIYIVKVTGNELNIVQKLEILR